MSSKACFKCGVLKDLSEYYVHKMMSDGHLNKCKDCTKKDTKARADVLILDPEWKEKERKRGREKHHRLKYKCYPVPKEKQNIGRVKFPEKYKANSVVTKMKREKGNHLHHWSYNEQHRKDVIELSIRHHAKAHRFIVYDQERMMYRRFDTNELLDTREAHEAFITDCIEKKPD